MKVAMVLLSLSLACAGQTVRVPTVTRTVQLFGDLERKLASANAAEKAQFLTDDFEGRLCAEPGDPIPRQAWLQKTAVSEATFSQEAVHSFGEIAIYSALESNGKNSDMIVDTWKKSDSGWKLAVRYQCPATGPRIMHSRSAINIGATTKGVAPEVKIIS